MEKIVFNVEGMSCSHCVNAITNSVGAICGVNDVCVDLDKKTVAIQYDGAKVSSDDLKNEIEEQGYEVEA